MINMLLFVRVKEGTIPDLDRSNLTDISETLILTNKQGFVFFESHKEKIPLKSL